MIPHRPIQTGIGPVEVSKPKARDRGATRADERIRYRRRSAERARRTKNLTFFCRLFICAAFPLATFKDVLTALLGKDAPNLSPSVIGRLKKRLEGRLSALASQRICRRDAMSMSGPTASICRRAWSRRPNAFRTDLARPRRAKRSFWGLQTGMRESGQSWKEMLVDLKARGLSIAPDIAVGDGALGFWKAWTKPFPHCHQRCWQHKTLNVLTSCRVGSAERASGPRETGSPKPRCRRRRDERPSPRNTRPRRQGRRLPSQGPRRIVDVLRFSCRALDASADIESD